MANSSRTRKAQFLGQHFLIRWLDIVSPRQYRPTIMSLLKGGDRPDDEALLQANDVKCCH